MNLEFQKYILNLYLNANFTPLSENIFIIENHPYMGYKTGLQAYPKACIFDFDGVFEFPGSSPLYKLFIEKLMDENRKLESRKDEIDESIKLILAGDLPSGEKKMAKIYRESEVKKEECEIAAIEAVKEFKFAKNARKLIQEIKKMGYCIAIISGSMQIALEGVGEILGIDKENIFGSVLEYDENGKVKDILLRLNFRKLEAQDFYLKKFINNSYGCRFFFTDDYVSDAPTAKFGLNPAIILNKARREELQFDVAACCPEAREDMLKLIPLIYKFEQGYVNIHLRSEEEEKKIIDLAREIKILSSDISKDKIVFLKKSFLSKSIELYKLLEKTLARKQYLKKKILELQSSESEEKDVELMLKITDFLKKYVAEFHAD
ncbi:MAG: HAD family hydrolase [Candidatus Aenigmatarchaeota archaeon]